MKKILILFLIVILSAVTAVSLFPVSSAQNGEYLLGDADGNGKINVNDVTLIQRVLAYVEEDADGSVALRGDVDGNGLDINDATYLEGYLVEFAVVFPIGETVTVPVTTTAAPRPSYELPFIPI